MEETGSHSNHEIDTSSDAEKTASCGACLSAGENRPAVKFCLDCSQPICQQCVDAHGRINTIRNHKLVENIDESAKLTEVLSSCLACANHPEKNVELICKDHEVMCCITCVTVGHRNCRQVSEIANEAKALIDSTEVQNVSRQLNAAKRRIGEIITLHRKHNGILETQREVDIPMQVRDVKRRVNEILDALEKRVQLESDVLALQETNRGLIEIGKWESSTKKVNEAIDVIELAQRSGSNVHIYVAINNIRKTLTYIEGVLAESGDRVVRRSVVFQEGDALKNACVLVNNERKALVINQVPKASNFETAKDATDESETKTGFFYQERQVHSATPNTSFGKATPQAPPGSIFGQLSTNIPAAVTSQTSTTSLYGGFGLGQVRQAPDPSVFGKPAVTTSVTNVYGGFGLGQVTQAPDPSVFGKPAVTTSATNVYGGFGLGQVRQAPDPSVFGKPAVTTSATNVYGGFGLGQVRQAPDPSVFGKPAVTTSATNVYGGFGLGQVRQAPDPSVFGKPAVTTSATNVCGGFGLGQVRKAPDPSVFGKPAVTTSATNVYGGFGLGQVRQAPDPSVFGKPAVTTSATNVYGGFGLGQVRKAPDPSVFGKPSVTTSATNVYGGFGLGQVRQAPDQSVFGKPAVTTSATNSYGGYSLSQKRQADGDPLMLASVFVRDVDYQLSNYKF